MNIRNLCATGLFVIGSCTGVDKEKSTPITNNQQITKDTQFQLSATLKLPIPNEYASLNRKQQDTKEVCLGDIKIETIFYSDHTLDVFYGDSEGECDDSYVIDTLKKLYPDDSNYILGHTLPAFLKVYALNALKDNNQINETTYANYITNIFRPQKDTTNITAMTDSISYSK